MRQHFARYLLGGAYLRGEPWHPPQEPPAVLHRAARSGGAFVHVEGGVPAWTSWFERYLDGIPRADVTAALASAAEADPAAGALLTFRLGGLSPTAVGRLFEEPLSRHQVRRLEARAVGLALAHLAHQEPTP